MLLDITTLQESWFGRYSFGGCLRLISHPQATEQSTVAGWITHHTRIHLKDGFLPRKARITFNISVGGRPCLSENACHLLEGQAVFAHIDEVVHLLRLLDLSDGTALGWVTAGTRVVSVCVRRALPAIARGRCRLVCHWLRDFPSTGRPSAMVWYGFDSLFYSSSTSLSAACSGERSVLVGSGGLNTMSRSMAMR